MNKMNPPSTCNTNELLHPHLMDTESIREYLKHRQLSIPNIEQQSREELLKIFHSYAMPLHKRSTARTKNFECQMETSSTLSEHVNSLENKHIRLCVSSSSSTSSTKHSNQNFNSMDLVTNGCKRIKIGNSNGSTSDNKRGLQDIKVDLSLAHKTKRQKITWP